MKLLVIALLMTLNVSSYAEEIQIPIGQQGVDGLQMPMKGETMTRVMEHFGAAKVQHPARGNPPITRWEYGNFVVYFEGQHVIHSVLRHKPMAEHKKPTNE
jgi:hypothetical protein